MTLNENELEYSYSPTTILALVPDILGKLVSVRGVYKKDNKKNNNSTEIFHDWLCDENSNTKIKVEISKNLRKQVKHGNSYFFKGILKADDRKNAKNAFKLIIDDFHERKIIKDLTVLNEKRNQGFKQPDIIIKNKIRSNQTSEIAFILSNKSVIDEEINAKLNSFSDKFQFSAYETDLDSKKSLTSTISDLKKAQSNFDALVILNTQNDSNESTLFDNSIAEKLLQTKYPLISTSPTENTLIDKISDMNFTNISDFSQFLHDIASDCCEKPSEEAEADENDKNNEDFQKLQKELNLANSTIDELEETIEQLNTQLETNDDRLAELEQSNNSIEMKLNNAQNDCETYKSTNQDFEKEINRLNTELNRESMTNTALNKNIQELKERNNEYANEIMDLKLEIDQNVKELGNQISKRTKIEDQLAEIQYTLSRSETDKQLIEDNKNKLVTEFEALHVQYDELQKEIEQLKDQGNQREKKIVELSNTINQKENALANKQLKSEAQLENLKKKSQILLIVISTIALIIGAVVGIII